MSNIGSIILNDRSPSASGALMLLMTLMMLRIHHPPLSPSGRRCLFCCHCMLGPSATVSRADWCLDRRIESCIPQQRRRAGRKVLHARTKPAHHTGMEAYRTPGLQPSVIIHIMRCLVKLTKLLGCALWECAFAHRHRAESVNEWF